MRKLIRDCRVALLVVMIALPVVALAQSSSRPTSGSDRLFLSFIEDATLVDNQWWEGQFEFADLSSGDEQYIGRAIVAFQPWKNVELGGRVGFGKTDSSIDARDGNGATDLDVWGKYYFLTDPDLEFTVGGIATVPTGDETALLGSDAFSLAGFGSARRRFEQVIVTAHVGARFNGDGSRQGPGGFAVADVDGKTSFFAGGGVLFPLSDEFTFVAEAELETKRFDGGDTDARVLGGVSWRLTNRGMLRAGLALGLTDGAPDGQLLVGYAAHF